MRATTMNDQQGAAGAPTTPVRLQASRATITMVRELLAESAVDLGLVAQLVEADPAVTVHLLRRANAQARDGVRVDTVTQALQVVDTTAVSALIDGLAGDMVAAAPQLWRILSRALTCEQLSEDRRGYTVGLLSAIGDLYGLPTETLLAATGVSNDVTAAVLECRGRTGAALGAFLAYLSGDLEEVAEHGFAPQAVYEAYLEAATTAMTTESVITEQDTDAAQGARATVVPQQPGRAPAEDRADRARAGTVASPTEEHR